LFFASVPIGGQTDINNAVTCINAVDLHVDYSNTSDTPGRAKPGVGGSGGSSPWADIAATGEAERSSASTPSQLVDLVDLAHQHTNRLMLVEGPEITVRPVRARVLTRNDAQRAPRRDHIQSTRTHVPNHW
jgi:hypothetical protein